MNESPYSLIPLYHIYYSHSWSLWWHWPSFMKDKIIALTKWKWESPLAWLCLTSHPNLSMVDCISKTRMPLFVDKRVSVGGHLVFSCQFYVGLWCKDYDQNKNNCGHEHCPNIVPKCYCGDKGLVISFPARPMLDVATLYRAMIQTPQPSHCLGQRQSHFHKMILQKTHRNKPRNKIQKIKSKSKLLSFCHCFSTVQSLFSKS